MKFKLFFLNIREKLHDERELIWMLIIKKEKLMIFVNVTNHWWHGGHWT